MASKATRNRADLNLTQEEANAMGIALPEEPRPVSVGLRELPFHEQVEGSMTEGDVTEAMTGEATDENREDVEELFADLQEQEADREGK